MVPTAPDTAPATVFFGERSGHSFFLPNSFPPYIAKASLIHGARNTSRYRCGIASRKRTMLYRPNAMKIIKKAENSKSGAGALPYAAAQTRNIYTA